MKIKISNSNAVFCSIMTIILIACVFSCNNITDEEKKHVGEWKYAYSNDDSIKPFWSKVEIQSIILQENGEWVLAKNHGKWGGKKRTTNSQNSTSDFDLHFNEWVINSPFANQVNDMIGEVVMIDGVNALKITFKYTYKDWGYIDDPSRGTQLSPNVEYSGSVQYYFAKKSPEIILIKNHFEKELAKDQEEKKQKLFEEKFKEISEQLATVNEYHWKVSFGYDEKAGELLLFGKRYKDNNPELMDIKDVLEYAIKSGKAKAEHEKLLKIILDPKAYPITPDYFMNGVESDQEVPE